MAIEKSNVSGLLEPDVVREIIKNATTKSSFMSVARRLTGATSNMMKLRVLDSLPVAYWVDAENGGYKRASSVAWENKFITFEELAVIIPIKEDLLQDADADIWGEIRPLVEEAIAKKIDMATWTGAEKPRNFDADVMSQAIASGAAVTATSNLYSDIDKAMEKVENSGYNPTAIIGGVGMKSAFRNLLDTTGQPITGTEIGDLPRHFVDNGAWDATKAKLMVGDFSQLVYAIREDVTYKILTESVIQDPDTKEIIYNLAQQDMVALRVFFRFGWALPNPVTALDDSDTRFPFAVITPSAPTSTTVTFTVSDAEGAIEGATVNFGGKIHKTNASGQAVFKYQEGTYKYTVKHGDYDPVTGALTISGSTAAKAITLA